MAAVTEVEESNRQLIGSALLICETFPGAEVVGMPGLIAAWCNTETPFLNSVALSEPLTDKEDLERRAPVLAEYLRSKEMPPLFYICREWVRNRCGTRWMLRSRKSG